MRFRTAYELLDAASGPRQRPRSKARPGTLETWSPTSGGVVRMEDGLVQFGPMHWKGGPNPQVGTQVHVLRSGDRLLEVRP